MKATAFANGLRKSLAAASRRWSTYRGGAQQAAAAAARVLALQQRIAVADAAGDEAAVARAVADLRVVLEWMTYQSAAVTAARALAVARRTRVMTRRLRLLGERDGAYQRLLDAEAGMIETVRTRNGYAAAAAQRAPHLALPPPLIDPATLVEVTATPTTGRLAMIQRLRPRR